MTEEIGKSLPIKQSPIYSKTYDMLLWLMNHTERFPKSERFRMGKRLEDAAFQFYDLLIEAARTKRKRQVLLQADLQLDRLRLYVRLSHARKLTTTGYLHLQACQEDQVRQSLPG